MDVLPSDRQFETLNRPVEDQPLALFYQYRLARPSADDPCRAPLAEAAARYRGRLIWAARGEEVLIGTDERYEHTCLFEFPGGRLDVIPFVASPGHARALESTSALEVTVLEVQPAAVGLLSALFARVLPRLPLDRGVDPGDAPGAGAGGIMPTAAALDEFRSHPDQSSPVVMINWLRFRPRARYAGTPEGGPVSGREAYHRYGRAAMLATHSIGAKLIYACRYRQVLIGNGGDPAPGRWHEFALMQYPGRRSFALMSSLRRYRQALPHREAGLAERGQSLVVSRPADDFTWRR